MQFKAYTGVLMQRANKNTRYTQLNGLESVTQVIQVIVTRQLITQVTLGRGLNRQERRLTQATSSRGISHVTGASNDLQLKVSSNGRKVRHAQTQAQQVTTLSTRRLRSQANQFLTQALVLRQNQRELRAEHALRDVQVLSSLLQCTSSKTQAERRLNQQERRGHIVQERLNVVAENVLARNENFRVPDSVPFSASRLRW